MAFSKKIFFSFLLLIFYSLYSFPQNDSVKTYNLSDVVITATKTETSILEVASSISIIDSAEIAHAAGASLFGLLKGEYGLTTSQSGGPGQLAQVYVRGADPEHVLVNVDGVKSNQPDDINNSFDFSYISPDNVERIEILRGPQSTLYGSDAMSGVINVITKKGSGKSKYFINVEGGSLYSYKGSVGTSGGYEAGSYSLLLSRAQSNGISAASERLGNFEKDGFEDYNISSRLGYQINSNLNLNFIARFKKGKKDLDQTGNLINDDSTYIHNHELGIYRVDAEYKTSDGMFEQKAGFSFLRNLRKYDHDSSFYNPWYHHVRSFYSGNSYQFDLQSNIRVIPLNVITVGVDWSKQTTSSGATRDSFEEFYPTTQINTISAYLQDQFSLDGSFFTTAGIRYDRYGSISAVTFRLAQAYFIKDTHTKLKAVYGTAFKAPSLYNLYDPTYGNKELKSEENKGWEVGIEQYFFNYRMQAGINYFNYDFTNMFGFDPSTYQTININAAKANGIEFFLLSYIVKEITIAASYTYTKAVDNSSGNEEVPLVRRPEHSASIKVSYEINSDMNINLNIQYAGERDDLYFAGFSAERVKLADYTIAGISAFYNITSYLQMYGRVDNLFDKKYEEVYGYGSTRLTAYAGIKLNIE